MAKYECGVCGYEFDEDVEGSNWADLAQHWECPVCGAAKSEFSSVENMSNAPEESSSEETNAQYLKQWLKSSDDLEVNMADIHRMAESGKSIVEPMRTRDSVVSWGDVLIKGAQLAKLPLNKDEVVDTTTIIGPESEHPLTIDCPIYVTHMSFGALSREIKLALAKGSAAARTAMCSGEGGILPESLAASHRYIFEYVPNEYSIDEDNLRTVDAIEIKIGQSAKPGLGGHLPAAKVTSEVAEIRGFPQGVDIISPARFRDITNKTELKKKVDWLRLKSGGKPIGIKLAAGHIEADLEVAVFAKPDFITIDGRPGATAAAPKFVKAACSIPTIFALYRARRYLDSCPSPGISLVITGGLRISSDFAKAIALGADAVAIGSAALIACACQQYRICDSGKCPVGVTSQNPELRSRLDIGQSAKRLENYLSVCTNELKDFARLTGNKNVHALGLNDLCTTNSEISSHTEIAHV